MAIFKVQAPDGSIIKVEAADEATAIAGAQEHYASLQGPVAQPSPDIRDATQADFDRASDPVTGRSLPPPPGAKGAPSPAEAADPVSALLGGPNVSLGEDVTKSYGSGAARSVVGMPGMLGDIENLWGNGVERGAQALGRKLGLFSPEQIAAQDAHGVGRTNFAHDNGHLTSQDMVRAAENAGGREFYRPQTLAGRYADTAGAFTANALIPGSGAQRLKNVLAPALASETAGELTAGTRYEGAARLAGALAGGIAAAPKAANALAAAPVAENSLAGQVAAFERAGVRPSLAATGGKGAATATKFISENPLAGILTRKRLNASLEDTAAAADRQARAYGTPRGPVNVGESVQEGVTRFAKDRNAPDSFKTASGAHYDKAFAQIPNGIVNPAETSKALGDITSRISAPNLGGVIKDPKIAQIAEAFTKDAGKVSFNDLRALRTWVREAKGDPGLRQGMSEADLARLEGALTQDISANAAALGGPKAAQSLRRADQFYAAGQQRIDRALEAFTDAKSGESAYQRILAAAGSSGTADIRKIVALKRSLRPSEWGDVASTMIDRLGRPSPGAAGAVDDAFSIDRFVTGYAKLSPQGREALFGSLGGGGAKTASLKAELDNLVRVADMQKNVERMANASKSGIGFQQTAMGAGLVAAPVKTGAILGGMTVTGEMLSSPYAVRWLANLSRARQNGPQAFASAVNRLGAAAKTNPTLASIYEQAKAQPGPWGTATAHAKEEDQ